MAEADEVAIVREVIDSFGRRDRLARVHELVHPEVVWDASAQPDGGVYHGHDGMAEFWRRWMAAWAEVRFEYVDVRSRGGVVVTFMRQYARGRASDIEVPYGPYAVIWTVADGRVVSWRMAAAEEGRAALGEG